MPQYSSYSPGTYNVTVPAYAQNVRFTIAAAGGGDQNNPTWGYVRGGFGRAGDFRLVTRTYDYTLTFYLGGKGGSKSNGSIPGGSGGSSPIATGGQGYRSGGGGGGASGVYDRGLNRYTVIVGGGGGAGRYGDTGYSGYYSAGRGIGGGSTTGSFSGRNGQSAPAGHRGGGGGGSNVGGAGSLGGAQTYNGYSGIGGNSAWYNNSSYYDWTTNSGYGNTGNGYYILNFDYAPPTIQYFTLEPSQILLGDSTVMSWSAIGAINTVTINPIGLTNQARQDSITISPTQDTTYDLVVNGPGGTASVPATIDVIIPPDVNLFSDATNDTIVLGESVNLSWTITGDASTAQMTPGVGEVNISGGPVQVSPTQDTTYTLTASHPLAGQDSDQVTITVLQPPTVSLTGPVSVDYGEQITLSIEATNSTTSLQLLAKYHYEDNPGTSYEIVEEYGPSESFNGEETVVVPYNDFGPNFIEYKLYAVGAGGLTDEDDIIVNINIDRMPDALDIPENDDAIKNEDPVISPDQEVTTVQLLVNDIDVPVKIKADYPIQVEIDNDGIYRDVEQI